jgi:hypothetical protein
MGVYRGVGWIAAIQTSVPTRLGMDGIETDIAA